MMREPDENGDNGFIDTPADFVPDENRKDYWNLKGFQNRERKLKHETKILVFSISIIIIYLILLTPYLVASNSGESGLVINAQKIDIASLPTDIQDLIPYKNLQYNAIVVVDQTHDVNNLKGQVSKERKLVISPETAQNNEFIRVDNIVFNIYAPANLIPGINQTFDTLIIGDTKKVGYGGIIEFCNNLKINPILIASRIDYLIGGFLVVLLITFICHKAVALWNIPAIIACYSFQLFIANIIANANRLEVNLVILLFGLLFIPALYLVFKVKEFEESKEGKKQITHLYRENIVLFTRLISKIKEIRIF